MGRHFPANLLAWRAINNRSRRTFKILIIHIISSSSSNISCTPVAPDPVNGRQTHNQATSQIDLCMVAFIQSSNALFSYINIFRSVIS
jgi:hypothetical protein